MVRFPSCIEGFHHISIPHLRPAPVSVVEASSRQRPSPDDAAFSWSRRLSCTGGRYDLRFSRASHLLCLEALCARWSVDTRQ
jgi:hypothetical protein